MIAISHGFANLAWFIKQATMEGTVYFVVPFLMFASLLVFAYLRQEANCRNRLLPLIVILPSIWLGIGLWGAFFWVDSAHGARNASWVQWVPTAAVALFLIVGCYYVWRLAGARLFALGYALTNFYFIAMMWLLAEFAITGDGF